MIREIKIAMAHGAQRACDMSLYIPIFIHSFDFFNILGNLCLMYYFDRKD